MKGPVSLARPPPYCAISYFAGDPHDTSKIVVDNVEFNAFANLDRAIKDAQEFWKKFQPREELLLWVDQICINQSDHSERSHQVGYMKEIYRNAAHVVIPLRCQTDSEAPLADEAARFKEFCSWIGPVRPGPALGNCGYQWLDNGLKEHQFARPLVARSRKRDFFFNTTTTIRVRARRELTKTVKALAGGWAVIYSILKHPWWRRAWVYQEFLMASRTTFYVVIAEEGVSVRWDKFHRFLRTCIDDYAGLSSEYVVDVVSRLHESREWDSADRDWKKRSKLRKAYDAHMRLIGANWPTIKATFESKQNRQRWGEEAQLSDTLRHARNFEASDARDKVYAFLGLASPDYRIIPDYSPDRSDQSVFTEATEQIIKTEGNLDVLEDAMGNDRLKSDNLSWVPDWASPIAPRYSDVLAGICMPVDCDASGPHRAEFAFCDHRSRSSSTRVLEVRAVFVGFLDRVIQDEYEASWRWHSCRSNNPAVGHINVATTDTVQSGDEVWIIYGVKWPVALRRDGPFRCLLGPAMLREPATPPARGRVSPIMYGSLCVSHGYSVPSTLSLM